MTTDMTTGWEWVVCAKNCGAGSTKKGFEDWEKKPYDAFMVCQHCGKCFYQNCNRRAEYKLHIWYEKNGHDTTIPKDVWERSIMEFKATARKYIERKYKARKKDFQLPLAFSRKNQQTETALPLLPEDIEPVSYSHMTLTHTPSVQMSAETETSTTHAQR